MRCAARVLISTSLLTALALTLLQCHARVDACSEEDAHTCPSNVPELSNGPVMGLLQAQKHMQRGHAAVHSHQPEKVSFFDMALGQHSSAEPPCSCQASSPNWKRPAPRERRCLFIDLGAADGNTFKSFLSNGYGPVENCPNGGDYAAVLVEANPFFDDKLSQLQKNYSVEKLRVLSSSAAYMCDGNTSFFLDKKNTEYNYWGSSLSSNHWDVKASGQQKVTVPLVNVIRLVIETAIPEDVVILKVDVEGAEWDIIPCLAKSPEAAKLIDAIYIERHPVSLSLAGTDKKTYEDAIAVLNQAGINTPFYSSPTL